MSGVGRTGEKIKTWNLKSEKPGGKGGFTDQ